MPVPDKSDFPVVTEEEARAQARDLVAEYNPEHLDGRTRTNVENGLHIKGLVSVSLLDTCAALIYTRGNVYKASKIIGISRHAVHRWANDFESVRKAIEVGREIRLDIWEDILDYQIEVKKEFIPLLFGLKTQGKSRGYVENQVVYNRINVQNLTLEQLERLASGEEPVKVLGEETVVAALKAPKDDVIDVEARDGNAP